MAPELSPELQNAQDMLTCVLNQRNAAQNECVQLAAQVIGKDRKIAELEAKVKAMELPPIQPIGIPPLRDWSNGNGHDTEAIQ